jgi:hypothetical protein
MIAQIAYNLRSGAAPLQDWGTLFFLNWQGSVIGVTARHVFATAKLATPIRIGVRGPGQTFRQGWEGEVIPILHPVADLAVLDFRAVTLPYPVLQPGSGNLGVGTVVHLWGASSTGLSLAPLPQPINQTGKIIASSHTLIGGRFQEAAFETDFPALPGCSGAPIINGNEVLGVYSRSGPTGGTLCVVLSGLKDIT